MCKSLTAVHVLNRHFRPSWQIIITLFSLVCGFMKSKFSGVFSRNRLPASLHNVEIVCVGVFSAEVQGTTVCRWTSYVVGLNSQYWVGLFEVTMQSDGLACRTSLINDPHTPGWGVEVEYWLVVYHGKNGWGEKKNSKDFKKAAVERQTVAAVDTFPF